MSKVFVSIDWRAFRKLGGSLVQAWIYGWTNCDPCGVFHFDEEYARIDLGRKVTASEYLQMQNFGVVQLKENTFLFVDFIKVNYVVLKPDYNPHKPVFRALKENFLELDDSLTKIKSSLGQASSKLEDEDEDKDEDKEEDVKERGMGKTKRPKKQSVLFRDSPVFEFSAFEMAFFGTDYEALNVNLRYYHESALNWSDSKDEKKVDWIATVKNWMARDATVGKLITNNQKIQLNGNGTHQQPPARKHQGQSEGAYQVAEQLRAIIESEANGNGSGVGSDEVQEPAN